MSQASMILYVFLHFSDSLDINRQILYVFFLLPLYIKAQILLCFSAASSDALTSAILTQILRLFFSFSRPRAVY